LNADFLRKLWRRTGSARREESKVLAEGKGIEARSEPPSAGKRVFRGSRHSSRKALPKANQQSTSDGALRAVKVFDRLTFLPELIRR
jgi:hypothetical protein